MISRYDCGMFWEEKPIEIDKEPGWVAWPVAIALLVARVVPFVFALALLLGAVRVVLGQ